MSGAESRRRGAWGEDLAAEYLEGKGYRITARGWRCRFGELDIVAEGGGFLCFVEVKLRTSEDFGAPSQAVNRTRMQRYINVARFYFSGREMSCTVRFDIIEVEGDKINHIISAFEAN